MITEPFPGVGVGWSGIGGTQLTNIVYVDTVSASGTTVTVVGRAASNAGPMDVPAA